MYLAWGGLPFPVTRILGFDGEVVMDPSGTDVLHTNYTVAVEIMLSRSGDAYRVAFSDERGPVPQYVPGRLLATQTATLSIAAIRHALGQRAPFALWETNPVTGQPDLLLASDEPDATNGPVPIRSVVLNSMHGQGNTAFIQFVFSCALRECPITTTGIALIPREIRAGAPDAKNPVTAKRTQRSSVDPKGGTPGGAAAVAASREHAFDATPLAAPRGRLVLGSINGRTPILCSNRWSTSTSIDPENEATIVNTRGTAIFNRQGLAALNAASIEQFTRSLVPPLVPNCVREVRDLTTSADGLSLSWDIVDREVPRGYVDFPCTVNNGRVRLVNPNGPPRHVAGVSLVSRREYNQPAVGAGIFEYFDNLSTINFANEPQNADAAPEDAVKGLPGVGEGAAAAGKAGKAEMRRFVNRTLATLRTINSLLPTVTEFAAAEVRGTRESRMQDLQALAISLCAGALGQGNGTQTPVNRTAQIARFAVLPPGTNFTIEADHVAAIVRCSLTVIRSGLIDFCLGEQQAAINRMLQPIPDDITGGRAVVGIFNVLDALGLLPSFAAVGGLIGTSAGITKLIDGTVVNKYADQLLITASDCILRGPTGDGLSRSLSANLVRVAASLLRPCQTPSGPPNQYLALPEAALVVEQQGTGEQATTPQPSPDPKQMTQQLQAK